MIVKTHGLVLCQTALSRTDRKLTLLTDEYGVLDAVLRSAQGGKSQRAAASEVLAYSDFCLYKGKSGYIINSADLEHNFYELRLDLQSLALASYFCELTRFVLPDQDNGGDCLRLLLNTLSLLERRLRPPVLLKALYELRLLALSGFAPDLTGCQSCGQFSQNGIFLPIDGVLFCPDCAHLCPADRPKFSLSSPVLAAMRRIIDAETNRELFSFQIDAESQQQLGQIAEYFMLCHAGGRFKALDFYHSVALSEA